MKVRHVLFISDGMNEISRSAKTTPLSGDRLKRHTSPFLEVGFKKLFDIHV